MSIPEPTHSFTAPAGWYPTGETGPDGLPVERWWDGTQWSMTVRPINSDTTGPRRNSRTKALIAAGVVVVLVGGGIGTYFAVHNSGSNNTTAAGAQSVPTPTAGSGSGGLGDGGGGDGGGSGGQGGLGSLGGLGGAPTATPAPTVAGGSGQTVSDPIDALTIPVPTGWSGTSGSATGDGSWPALSTGPYTCPSALAQANGSSGSSAECTRGGVTFATTSGTTAQATVTSNIASIAKGNYGTLTSHSVTSQGAITVAGRAGYQITWSVVPNYSGPSGTVELIAVPVPSQTGYFTLIDIGVDQSSQAPSLNTVNSQIISVITDSSATGA
jgi:Protein of unknown function (DUF2510)